MQILTNIHDRTALGKLVVKFSQAHCWKRGVCVCVAGQSEITRVEIISNISIITIKVSD